MGNKIIIRSLSARRKAETGSTLRRALEDLIEDLVNDSVSNYACVVASFIDHSHNQNSSSGYLPLVLLKLCIDSKANL